MKTNAKQVELLNEVYEALKEIVRQEEEFHNFGSEYCEKPEYEETVLDLKQRCLLYTSPSPRDLSTSRMPSSA